MERNVDSGVRLILPRTLTLLNTNQEFKLLSLNFLVLKGDSYSLSQKAIVRILRENI